MPVAPGEDAIRNELEAGEIVRLGDSEVRRNAVSNKKDSERRNPADGSERRRTKGGFTVVERLGVENRVVRDRPITCGEKQGFL